MRIRRKANKCLNCGAHISEVYNFCPKCGQENNDNNISFGLLFREFFSNYFSLDSRFGRSIKPFLISPGTLTNAFNEGKRVRFAHPVRLYLVISLIHFTVFSFIQTQENEESGSQTFIEMMDEVHADSLLAMHPDSIQYDPEEDFMLSDREFALIKKMYSENHTSKQILDSLHIEGRSFWDRMAIRRIVRLSNTTQEQINNAIIGNIPVMMFVILPLYALLLKLFYRKKGLYIQHLIHSFHIHSFAFFALTIGWLFILAFSLTEENVLFVVFLGLSIYIYFSLVRVCRQSYLMSFVKLFAMGTVYFFLLTSSIVIEAIISLIIY
ncbi:MAG: DUF3667 domain-containing protein [Cytophagales bacterium]|nr:DUF3667 domain-containing protein [Cytophagales bacterium]